MKKILFNPATASDDEITFLNPDRGFRTEINIRIEKTRGSDENYDWRTVFADSSEAEKREVIDRIFDIYFLKDKGYISKLTNAYLYITSCHEDVQIPENVKATLRLYFEMCRERKIKNNVRFAYNWNYAISCKVSDENKELLKSECASEEIILSHIDQLAPIICEYKDTIHKISSGFIGYGGEMASDLQYPQVSFAKVIKAVMEKFCVPSGLLYSCRLPEYKKSFTDAYPDFPFADQIGINNDAMFGEQTNPYWESAWYQKGNPRNLPIDWWEQVALDAPTASQDGELYTTRGLLDTSCGRYYNPRVPSGMQIILECFRHRHTQMSHWHSYHESCEKNAVIDKWIKSGRITSELLDANGMVYDEARYHEFLGAVKGKAPKRKEGGYPETFLRTEDLEHATYLESVDRDCVMKRWIDSEEITEDELIANAVTFDPDWFYDDCGNSVKRNPYEFLRDHLGYRIKLQSANYSVSDTINIELTLKNFGFASAFNLESGFAVLDSDNNLICEILAGEPKYWHSHDPADPYSDKILTHTIYAKIEKPNLKNIKLAFFMRNSLDEYVRTVNKCEVVNGYHIIDSVNL